jgi:hypothetical protein
MSGYTGMQHTTTPVVGRLWIVPGEERAGRYYGGLCFELRTKPKWPYRLTMRAVFGWTWEDA